MPPNLMPTNGSVSASRPRHTVTVTSFECFIAHAGMRPHSEFIDCSRVRPARRTLHLSMFVPSRPNSAGSTVSDSSAAKPTADIAPYATDFRKACGEQQQPGQGDGDHRGGEHHRLAGRRRRVGHRLRDGHALGHLLAEARHHEQAVVDGQAQAQQRHHRLGEGVDLRDRREHREDAQRTGDGQDAHDQRHRRRDHAAEDDEQQQRDASAGRSAPRGRCRRPCPNPGRPPPASAPATSMSTPSMGICSMAR